jgi:hypothetical protein
MAGVARIIADAWGENAEFAILIADSWQRQGKFGQLLENVFFCKLY